MTLQTAHSRATASEGIVADLIEQFGPEFDPSLIVFFAAHQLDGVAASQKLRDHYATARVIGCTTAGEFTQDTHSIGATSAIAFSKQLVPTLGVALARFDEGVAAGISGTLEGLENQLGVTLRGADPERYIGIVLLDGLHGSEEEANRTLGNAAPFLSFVGGSAGDNLEFAQTRVFVDGEVADHGAALVVAELGAPFTVLKTCSFAPSSHSFTITKADQENRVVYEVDGRPVLEAYAEAVGTNPDQLDGAVFMRHPLGIMIEDQPWIRSPQQQTDDGGLKFYCQIPEGMEVSVMEAGDLVGDTRKAIDAARDEVGGRAAGALLFNCILRRLELDADDAHDEFLESFAGIPTAGFHTYGESWLGHINQTCTGILVGT